MGDVKLNSSGGGSVTLTPPSTASNLTVTLPSASGTLATTSGSLSSPTITGTVAGGASYTSPTLTGPTISGTVTGGTYASASITAANSNTVEATSGPTSSQLAGQRNKIINGAMMIDQRNAGASVALTNTENYVIDRWIGTSYGGNSVSFSRSTIVPSGSATDKAFANSFSATNGGSTAAGTSSFYTFRHKIEGNNIYDLGLGTASAQSFTVSFWARSSVTGTYVVAILNGAANWGNRSTFTINAANTWEYKTVTFSGTSSGTWVSDNTTGMYLDIVLSAGSGQNSTANTWTSGALESTSSASNTWCATNGATFYITGVQLEKGATATPFENRLFSTELALCQRYYEKNYNIDAAPGTSAGSAGAVDVTVASNGSNLAVYQVPFAVVKRAIPSMTGYRNIGTSGQWTYERSGVNPTGQTVSFGGLGAASTYAYVNVGAAWTACEIYGFWVASAEL